MAEQRLPLVDGDDGAWGGILNQYIEKEHYNTGLDNSANGGHKNVTLRPGAAVAGAAPLKFTSGSLLTAAEAGAVEYLSGKFYFTDSTPTRKTAAIYDDSSGATGDVYYRDSGGNFVRLAVSATPSSVLYVNGGLPAWGPAVATGLTASTIAQRDANINLAVNNAIEGYATTATAAGTTNLLVSSAYQQFFTGSTTQTIKMPDVTSSLVTGQQWQIVNDSTGALTINPYGSASLIIAMSPGIRATLTCISTSSNAVSSWSVTVDVSKQFNVGVTDPSTYGSPATGDVWIDTN